VQSPDDTPKYFVTRPLSIDPREILPGARVFAHDRAPSRDELIEGARGASAIITSVSDPIDGALLDAIGSIRHIAQAAVGYDNVDVDACRARGVLVTHTPDVLTDATADLAFTLILAVARRVREGEKLVRSGGFDGWSPTMLLGVELAGRTLGIFGYGRIGKAVARRAEAFGMRVIHSSRSGGVSFDRLLTESDVISLHAPLDASTRHRFGAAELARMKPGSILINTARGPLIDEAAIAAALDTGPLFGVGLDVYEREPTVHPSLMDRDDVVLLPHLGSATHEARGRMARTACTDALRVANGQPPLHPIPELRR
jgi:glyoxylate reductase